MEYRNTQLFVLPTNAIAADGLTTVATVQSGSSSPGSTAVNAVADGVVGFAINGANKNATTFKGMPYTVDSTNISAGDWTGMATNPKSVKVIRGFNPTDDLSAWAGVMESGDIFFNNITSIRQVNPSTTEQVMIKQVGFDATSLNKSCYESLRMVCGNTYSLQLRAKSFLADSISAKGLVKSYTVNTGCCEDQHCTNKGNALQIAFSAAYDLVNQINTDPMMKGYITAQVVGFYTADPAGAKTKTLLTGSTTLAGITADLALAPANDVDVEGTDWAVGFKLTGVAAPNWNNPSNPIDFQFRNDGVIIGAYFSKGKPVGEPYVWDACTYAPVTLIQDLKFKKNTGKEIQQMEIIHNDSHNIFKEVFYNTAYNTVNLPKYTDIAQYYTLYYIDYKVQEDNAYNSKVPQDRRVILAVPVGSNAGSSVDSNISDMITLLSTKSGVPIITE